MGIRMQSQLVVKECSTDAVWLSWSNYGIPKIARLGAYPVRDYGFFGNRGGKKVQSGTT